MPRRIYRAAIKTDPRFIDALYNLADLLDDQGRTKKRSASCARRSMSIRHMRIVCSTWRC